MTTALTFRTKAEAEPERGCAEPARALRVLLVTPRVVGEQSSTGRDKLLRGLVDQGAEIGAVETVTIPNIFAGRNSIGRLVGALTRMVGDGFSGRPASLQSLLFRGRAGEAALAEAVRRRRPDILYFDSIRLAHLVPRGPDRPCVVMDLDDLLSRRIQAYKRAGVRQGVGELGRSIPGIIVALLEQPFVSRIYLAVEKYVTRRAELRAARDADALVLTSPAEARALARYARRYAKATPLVMSHPLGVKLKAPIPRGEPQRFTFIGTSRLPQNQDGIRWCRKLAASAPEVPVEIYGSGQHPPTPGAPRFFGFVEDLARVYGPDAMPTCMTRVRGGIKTKVLEAWSFGAPILVTPEGLEGIDIEGYPLLAPWNTPVAEVREMMTPHAIETAVAMGREYLRATYDAESVGARWRVLLARALENYDTRRGRA